DLVNHVQAEVLLRVAFQGQLPGDVGTPGELLLLLLLVGLFVLGRDLFLGGVVLLLLVLGVRRLLLGRVVFLLLVLVVGRKGRQRQRQDQEHDGVSETTWHGWTSRAAGRTSGHPLGRYCTRKCSAGQPKTACG